MTSWTSPDGVATALGVMTAIWGIYTYFKARNDKQAAQLEKVEREKHASELAAVKTDLEREVTALGKSCSTNWEKLDEMRKELALCIKREEHDRMRQEIKADLKAMEDRITELFRETVRQITDRGGHS